MGVISANSVRLSHVEETTAGVTPATPTFELWRLTSESLSFTPNTIASAELAVTGRSARPSTVVGTTVSGDINFELSKFTALEEAIAGVLANTWGDGPLTPGSTGGAIDSVNRNTVGDSGKTFTIEKRWPNLNSVDGAMPITTADDPAPGASLDITLGAGTAIGTGIIVVDYQTDADNVSQRVFSAIAVGDDQDAAAMNLAAVLNAETNVAASAIANVVTVTAAGGATTITALASRVGSDEFVYQRFKGCTYSALSLTTTPNAQVTGTVSVVAGEPALDYLALTGSTYTDPGSSGTFTAPRVLELTAGTLPGIATSCWSSITINLNSQNREIACIGSLGSRESALGTFVASMSGDLYFVGDQSALEALLNDTVLGTSTLTVSNAAGELYRFDLYNTKITGGTVVASGENSDVTIPVVLEPGPVKVQEDGGDIWTSSVIVSLVNTAPTLPP